MGCATRINIIITAMPALVQTRKRVISYAYLMNLLEVLLEISYKYV